jgi:hypothetical protein
MCCRHVLQPLWLSVRPAWFHVRRLIPRLAQSPLPGAHRGGVDLAGEEDAGGVQALRRGSVGVGRGTLKAGRVARHAQLAVICDALRQPRFLRGG